MKKLILFVAITALAACNGKQTQEEEKTEDHQSHSPSTEASLDEDQKWKANPETTTGIENMKLHIRKFEEGQSENYPKLQKELKNEFKVIINKCTMKGEAHDQLHVYLMPLKGQIERLSSENLDTIKEHLQHYNRYFE